MIKAVFYRKNGVLSGFHISGHAGYAAAGSDVCCAAVSSAAQLVCNTVTDFFCDENARADAKENSLELLTDGNDPVSGKLIESFFTHMGFIAEEFPEGVKLSVKNAP